MRNAALLVLVLALTRCAASPDTSSAAAAPGSYAEEVARTDFVCSGDEHVGEAEEPLSWLTAACLVAVGVGFHIGCSRGLLDAYCPPGTEKVIYDRLVKTKSVSIDCDRLHDVVCGVGAVTAVELMRDACGAVP
jgi:hypothetical protein